VQQLNLAIRFVLELCMLAAYGYWGSHFGDSTGANVTAAVLAVAVAAAVWGAFVSPKAAIKVSEPVRWAIEGLLFAGAAVGLVVEHHAVLGIALLVVALANGALVRAPAASPGSPS
jgi:uncharacterized membrane protein